jgi:glycosyltransferase involved in cell wall biosynthesis
MSVVMVCPQYHPVIGGYESLAQNLARSLNGLGLHCGVVTRRLQPTWPTHERHQGVSIVRLPATRRRGLDGPLWYAGLLRYLLENRRRIEVVHVHQVGTALLAAATFSRLTDIPLVAHPHSGSGATVAQVSASRKAFLLRAALRSAQAVVALSDEMSDQMVALGVSRARIRRIGNAVDVARFRPREGGGGAPTAISVGRLSPEKGGDVLLNAWAVVRRALPAARLIIVGDGPMRADLEALAGRLGLGPSVDFRGAVREGIEDCYREADLFVLPSHREGVSVALLEALASGLPVVATRLPSIEAVVARAEVADLVPPGDSAALGLALADALARPDPSRAARARDLALREYDLPAVARSYAALYRSLTARA